MAIGSISKIVFSIGPRLPAYRDLWCLSHPESGIPLSVLSPAIDVNSHEDGNGRPDHKYKEEERVSDVASSIRDEADD